MQGALHLVLTIRFRGSFLHTVLACNELAGIHSQADIPVVGVTLTFGLRGKHGDGDGRVVHPGFTLNQLLAKSATCRLNHALQLGLVERAFTQRLGLTGAHVVFHGCAEERDGLVQAFHAVLVSDGRLGRHGGVLGRLGAGCGLVVGRLRGVTVQDCNTGVVATCGLRCSCGSRGATGCRCRAAGCLGLCTACCQEGRTTGYCEQAEGGSAGYVLHGFSLSVVYFPHRGAGDAWGI